MFIPGFEQPGDPSAVDAAENLHFRVIERDLLSQRSERIKFLSKRLLKDNNTSNQVDQHKSPYDTVVAPVQEPAIQKPKWEGHDVSFDKKAISLEKPLPKFGGIGLKESCGTTTGDKSQHAYKLPTAQRINQVKLLKMF